MKRNKALALVLLLSLEEVADGGSLTRHELKVLLGQTEFSASMSSEELWDALDYHLRILVTAGFVIETESSEGMAHDDFDLTWAGHDFLDAHRPEGFVDYRSLL